MCTKTRKTLLYAFAIICVALATAAVVLGVASLDARDSAYAATGTPISAITGSSIGTGTYYLAQDVTVNNTVEIASGNIVKLDLNGHKLALASGVNGSVIAVKGKLTLSDSTGGGSVTGGNNTSTSDCGGGVRVESDAELEMTGGSIEGNLSKYGGGVYIEGGTFTMSGGKITGNSTTQFDGGGVYVSGGSFEMTDGAISENHSTRDAGGVYVSSNGEFTMKGNALVSDNTAASGGGVYVSRGTFTMDGGTIKGNTAETSSGGGVKTGSKFIMNNGLISGNTAETNGGGVLVDANAEFKMSGGIIGGSSDGANKANNGGGVYVWGNKMAISGGTISYNEATKDGGGVYASGTTFEISGNPVISNNKQEGSDNNISNRQTINITGNLTDGAEIYINTLGTITGYRQDTTPGKYFYADDPTKCVYVSDTETGTIAFGSHSFKNHVCEICGRSIAATVTVGEDVTEFYTFAEAWTEADNGAAATVKMLADAEISDTLTVNHNVILDLNGYKLSLKTEKERSVIRVNGTFTLEDNETNTDYNKALPNTITVPDTTRTVEIDCGVVTGGDNGFDGGGGVYVNDRGTFTMSGGAIAGNTAYYGSGVRVHSLSNTSGGTFIMTGGIIEYNSEDGVTVASGSTFRMSDGTICYNAGRGVTALGTLEMSGGTITGNSGGGVNVDGGALKVSGAAKIIGNGGNSNDINVRVANEGSQIIVTGALTDGAQIGVTLDNGLSAFTAGYGENNKDTDGNILSPGRYFVSDDENYAPALNEDGEVELAAPVATVSAGGNTVGYADFSDAWQAANDKGTATVKMLKDAEIAATVKVAAGNNITLDLNGYMLALRSDATDSVIRVEGKFTLEDNTDNTDYNTDAHRQIVSPITGESVDIDGGLITGGSKAGVYVTGNSSVTFRMTGGTVAGNSARNGGGVYVYCATFEMTGGTISYNKSSEKGGGVQLSQGSTYASTFIMSGGTISYNDGLNGGGVYLDGYYSSDASLGSRFEMNGGMISNNNARTSGGGVYISRPAEFVMNKGSIRFNTAERSGGGVCVGSVGRFKMSDGADISFNTAQRGGGGVQMSNSTFEMTGGTITGNIANAAKNLDYGGGVHTASGTFRVSGNPKIYGNYSENSGDSPQSDDDVYLYSSETITVGTLTDGAKIGVRPSNTSAAFTSGYADNNQSNGNTVSPSKYFTSNRDKYLITLNGDGEVVLVSPVASVKVGDEITRYIDFSSAWRAACNAATTEDDPAKITLLANAQVGAALYLGAGDNVVLDLDGYMLALKADASGSVIVIQGGTFLLKDSNSSGIEHKYDIDSDGKWVFSDGGSRKLAGGLITGGNAQTTPFGGCVRMHGGTFTMTGGTVAGNAANSDWESSDSMGGGVYVSGGAFIMTGGTVAGNVASGALSSGKGGGVFVYGGTFTMNGGTVESNTAANDGGGVYVYGGTFTMTGGEISGNKAGEKGGGVYVADLYNGDELRSSATFNASGAITVDGNKTVATDGAGLTREVAGDVYLTRGKTITVTGELNYEQGNAKIGITLESVDGVFTDGYGVNNEENGNAVSPDRYFIGCVVLDGGEAAIGNHNYENGVCTRCGAKMQIYWGVSENGEKLVIGMLAGDVAEADSNGNFDFDMTFEAEDIPWYGYIDSLTAAEIKSGANGKVAPKSTANWFKLCRRLENIDLSGLDTSDIADMSNMFNGCLSLISLDLSSFNTARVKNMFYMFANCSKLTSLDLTSFDTSQVTDMSGMFAFCHKLTSLDLSPFDTSKIISMDSMFIKCQALTSIDLSSFDTSNVEQMYSMFKDCSALTSLDLSSFDTASVAYMSKLFEECGKLQTIKTPKAMGASGLPLPDTTTEWWNGSALITGTIANTCVNKTVIKHDGHTYGWVTVTEATCEQAGSKKEVCVCGNESGNTDTIAALGHSYGEPDWSWSDDGKTASAKITCANDGTHVISGNAVVTGAVKTAATCTEKGTTTYTAKVTLNGKEYTATKDLTDIEMTEHSYGGWQTVTAATCSAQGSKKHICTACGHEESEAIAIDPDAHSFGAWVSEVAATCSATGTKGHKDCSLCHNHFDNSGNKIADLTIAKDENAHSWNSGEITTQPTCTTEGVRTFTCTHNLEHTRTESVAIDENAHSWGEWTLTKAATCTENGEETRACIHNSEHKQTREILATGHSLSDNVVRVEPTCTADGSVTATCAVCGTVFTEILPALGHNLSHYEAKAPTCTENGWNEYDACSRCDHTTREDIAALGHDYSDEFTTDIAATCEQAGSKSKHCSRCDATTETTVIPALGHDWGEWTVVKQSTLEEFGEKRRVCSHDDTHVETENIPKRVQQLIKPDDNGDNNDIVIITQPDGFAHDIQLIVSEISADNYARYESVADSVNGEIGFVYDVSLKRDGISVQPDGTLTIRLRIPENLKGKTFKLFHMHGGEATDMQFTVEGNYAIVSTDKLSEFIFVGEKDMRSSPETVWIVLIAILAAVVALEICYIVYKEVRKKKAAEGRK